MPGSMFIWWAWVKKQVRCAYKHCNINGGLLNIGDKSVRGRLRQFYFIWHPECWCKHNEEWLETQPRNRYVGGTSTGRRPIEGGFTRERHNLSHRLYKLKVKKAKLIDKEDMEGVKEIENKERLLLKEYEKVGGDKHKYDR